MSDPLNEEFGFTLDVAACLRAQVALRVRDRHPGVRQPFNRARVEVTLEEAEALVRLVDAAKDCAGWHMAQGTKHVTDVKLWEAVTGRDRRADGGTSSTLQARPEGADCSGQGGGGNT